MFWNRSLNWLLENYSEEEELLFRFGRNAYLKTRNVEGDRAFKYIKYGRIKKYVGREIYKNRARIKRLAKKIYLKLRM